MDYGVDLLIFKKGFPGAIGCENLQHRILVTDGTAYSKLARLSDAPDRPPAEPTYEWRRQYVG